LLVSFIYLLKYMIKFYFLTILFSCTLVVAQQSAIKRSSLSTSVVNAHDIQVGHYKVQQSIGHFGIMNTDNLKNYTVTRGFLLPKYGASKENPIPEFDWVVYPNPFESYINIDFDIPVFGNLTIYLHDVTGQLIIEKKVIARQQNPSSPVTILNVLNQTGTYKTHFAMPAGGEINVLVEREGYAPWTETLPDGELNFIREVTTSLSSITGANQILTIDLLIKLLQKTEAVLNSVNTQGLPVPTVNVTTNTTSSTGPPSVDNQNVELGILTNILAKLTAIRDAVEQP